MLTPKVKSFLKAGIPLLLITVLNSSTSSAIPARNQKAISPKISAGCLPNKDQCTHKAGQLWSTATNYGFWGNQMDRLGLRDCLTGGPSSSAEFPGGSLIEYLFQGAIWVGGIVNGDTLVSIGTDGWVFDQDRGELHADCDLVGAIIRRSTNPSSPYYDPVALSDMDFIVTMYDTLTDPQFVENPDPQDNKPFKPLELKLVQTSLSYTGPSLEDIIFIHYKLENIGPNNIQDAYVGFFWDGDIGHINTPNLFEDDFSGLFQKDTVINSQPLHIEVPYVVDEDGDPVTGIFRSTSPTAVVGFYLLRASQPLVKTSFNWWTPNGTVALDWGPQKAPGRLNFSGGRGQPEGDGMKYYYISNGEKDYDQVWSALNHGSMDYGFGTGWTPPLVDPSAAVDIASGFDARYLYSFGPFQLAPGDTASFAIAVLAGTGFHNNPQNFALNLGAIPENYTNPAKIRAYQNGLDFSDLITKAIAAKQKLGIIAVRGDMNGDGWLSMSDAVLLLNVVFMNSPPANLTFHDLNCDGNISAADLVLLLNLVFLGSSLPC